MSEEVKSLAEINLPTSSMLLRKAGRFASSFFGDDIYNLYIFNNYMIQIIGEKKLVEALKKDNSTNKDRLNNLGENWDKFSRKNKEFGTTITELKYCWDMMSDKKFEKIQGNESFIKMSNYAQELPSIIEDLFALNIFFISNTGLKNMGIPSDAYTTFDSTQKKFQLEKRKLGEPIIHREY